VQLRAAAQNHQTPRRRVRQEGAQLRRKPDERSEQLASGAAQRLERPSQRAKLFLFRLRCVRHRARRVAPSLVSKRRRKLTGGDASAVDGQLERVLPLDVERARFAGRAHFAEPEHRGSACLGCHGRTLRWP
jgi:hypothetical protein